MGSEEIIVGTHEEFLLGYNIKGQKKDDSIDFEASFSNHAHMGSVRKVAIDGDNLISAGTDEYIRIFDLKKRCEVGCISNTAIVTCLDFHSGFLFTANEEGKISIYRKKNWELMKVLKGHVSPITGLAIHSSGKLALSVSKDKKMVTWDLAKRKRAYISALKIVPDMVMWSPGGDFYLITSETVITVFSTESSHILHSVNFKDRIHAIRFINDNICLIGGEGGNIRLFNVSSGREVLKYKAHDNRVKALTVLSMADDVKRFSSASSDGFIKVWQIKASSLKSGAELLGKLDTTCRIICMAARQSISLPESSNNLTEGEVQKKGTIDEGEKSPSNSKKSRRNRKRNKPASSQEDENSRREKINMDGEVKLKNDEAAKEKCEGNVKSFVEEDGLLSSITEGGRIVHEGNKPSKKRKIKKKLYKEFGFEVVDMESLEDELKNRNLNNLPEGFTMKKREKNAKNISNKMNAQSGLDFEVVDLNTLNIKDTNSPVDIQSQFDFEVVDFKNSSKSDKSKPKKKKRTK